MSPSVWNFSKYKLKSSNFWRDSLPKISSRQIFSLGTASPIRCFPFSGFVYSSWLAMCEYNIWIVVKGGLSLQNIAQCRNAAMKGEMATTAASSFPFSISFTPVQVMNQLYWDDFCADHKPPWIPAKESFIWYTQRRSLNPFSSWDIQV